MGWSVSRTNSPDGAEGDAPCRLSLRARSRVTFAGTVFSFRFPAPLCAAPFASSAQTFRSLIGALKGKESFRALSGTHNLSACRTPFYSTPSRRHFGGPLLGRCHSTASAFLCHLTSPPLVDQIFIYRIGISILIVRRANSTPCAASACKAPAQSSVHAVSSGPGRGPFCRS